MEPKQVGAKTNNRAPRRHGQQPNSMVQAGARREQYLDVRGAAAYLGTTERHLRRLVAERRISFYKLAGSKLRFSVDDLAGFMADSRVERVR